MIFIKKGVNIWKLDYDESCSIYYDNKEKDSEKLNAIKGLKEWRAKIIRTIDEYNIGEEIDIEFVLDGNTSYTGKFIVINKKHIKDEDGKDMTEYEIEGIGEMICKEQVGI